MAFPDIETAARLATLINLGLAGISFWLTHRRSISEMVAYITHSARVAIGSMLIQWGNRLLREPRQRER